MNFLVSLLFKVFFWKIRLFNERTKKLFGKVFFVGSVLPFAFFGLFFLLSSSTSWKTFFRLVTASPPFVPLSSTSHFSKHIHIRASISLSLFTAFLLVKRRFPFTSGLCCCRCRGCHHQGCCCCCHCRYHCCRHLSGCSSSMSLLLWLLLLIWRPFL